MTGSVEAVKEIQERIQADLLGIQAEIERFREEMDAGFDRIEVEMARRSRITIETRAFLRKAIACARERRQASPSPRSAC